MIINFDIFDILIKDLIVSNVGDTLVVAIKWSSGVVSTKVMYYDSKLEHEIIHSSVFRPDRTFTQSKKQSVGPYIYLFDNI